MLLFADFAFVYGLFLVTSLAKPHGYSWSVTMTADQAATTQKLTPPTLPDTLATELKGFAFTTVKATSSNNHLWKLQKNDEHLYLKIRTTQANECGLRQEAEKLAWFAKLGFRVPRGQYFLQHEQTEYLVTHELRGQPATKACDVNNIKRTIELVAEAAHLLHTLDTQNCPHDQSLDKKLEQAKTRMQAGLVNEFYFEEHNQKHSSKELYDHLLKRRPQPKDLVVCHGKFSLENIFVENNNLSGLVGLGAAGLASPYQDLASMTRSIIKHVQPYGAMWAERFLEAYGLEEPDREQLAYYRLLTEFF